MFYKGWYRDDCLDAETAGVAVKIQVLHLKSRLADSHVVA